MSHQDTTQGLWLHDRPLVLASGSATRRDMLVRAGIPIEVQPAAIDERALEAALPSPDGTATARALAIAKARDVAHRAPGRLVLAADQTLVLDGRAFHKPVDAAEARAQLQALQGRRHELVSAFVLAQNDTVLAAGHKAALMQVRPLSVGMIDRYLAAAGAAATTSVGGYQLEALGVHLMEAVEGDHFTVLGLPMIELLACLRDLGAVAA